jgi:hypothetical protein
MPIEVTFALVSCCIMVEPTEAFVARLLVTDNFFWIAGQFGLFAEEVFDLGQKFEPVNRLYDIVAAAAYITGLHALHLRLGRHHDDGHRLGFLPSPQPLDGLKAVHSRHHDIHEDQIGLCLHGFRDALFPVSRHHDLIGFFLQDHLFHHEDSFGIIHQQDFSLHHALAYLSLRTLARVYLMS